MNPLLAIALAACCYVIGVLHTRNSHPAKVDTSVIVALMVAAAAATTWMTMTIIIAFK